MTCKMGHAYANLPTEDQTLLDSWIATGADHKGRPVSAVGVSKALALVGFVVGATTVKDHRAGRCACP